MHRMDRLTRLAHEARLGDGPAIEAFIQAAYPDVWRLCAALVDHQTADDLAQESFLRMMRALPRFRGDSSARVWSLAIAKHTCMDELRARQRHRRRQHRLHALAEPATATQGSDLEAHDLLRALEPDRRVAFVLTQLFRLSYEQAAQICDCPAGTIRSRVARARHELITLIEEPTPARANPKASP
jgi:RNA polymerase sigma-70 factor, ECF subfamily